MLSPCSASSTNDADAAHEASLTSPFIKSFMGRVEMNASVAALAIADVLRNIMLKNVNSVKSIKVMLFHTVYVFTV